VIVDWFERRIVQYMLQWHPFGGPPEDDVLPHFGMSPPQLERRFNRIVKKMENERDSLREEDSSLLIAVYRIKPEAAVRREPKSVAPMWRSLPNNREDRSA
jgi:hypothetical protein